MMQSIENQTPQHTIQLYITTTSTTARSSDQLKQRLATSTQNLKICTENPHTQTHTHTNLKYVVKNK